MVPPGGAGLFEKQNQVSSIQNPVSSMKIYIAGKITGLQKQQYTSKFRAAEIELTAAGHHSVNPCRLGIPDDYTSEQAVLICLTHLRHCDAIYLLPCWQQSPGAITERQYAIEHGIEVIYADHEATLIHQTN